MNLALDIADDFQAIVDGLAQVSVDWKTVPTCLRRAITTKEAGRSDGKYLTSDTVFHLDIAEHPARPAIGGQIVESDGEIWTILEVAKQTLSNRWRCICRQLYIDPSFTVTLLKAVYEKGITGAQEPTWQTIAENVVAKIQIDRESVEVEHEYRTSVKTASVYFAQPQPLSANHRIAGPNGEVLKVIAWEGLDDVTRLFEARCEISQWPQA